GCRARKPGSSHCSVCVDAERRCVLDASDHGDIAGDRIGGDLDDGGAGAGHSCRVAATERALNALAVNVHAPADGVDRAASTEIAVDAGREISRHRVEADAVARAARIDEDVARHRVPGELLDLTGSRYVTGDRVYCDGTGVVADVQNTGDGV